MRLILALLMCLTSMVMADSTSDYKEAVASLDAKYKMAKVKAATKYLRALQLDLDASMDVRDLKSANVIDSKISRLRAQYKGHRLKAEFRTLRDTILGTYWNIGDGKLIGFKKNMIIGNVGWRSKQLIRWEVSGKKVKITGIKGHMGNNHVVIVFSNDMQSFSGPGFKGLFKGTRR